MARKLLGDSMAEAIPIPGRTSLSDPRDAEITRLKAEAVTLCEHIKAHADALAVVRVERDAALVKIREHNEKMDAECEAIDRHKAVCGSDDEEQCRHHLMDSTDWCADCPRRHRIEVDA